MADLSQNGLGIFCRPPTCTVRRAQDRPHSEDPRGDRERLAIKLQNISEHNNVFNHIQF